MIANNSSLAPLIPFDSTLIPTVTPVNDAPVAGDRSASTSEDTPLTLDLLAGASDVDGDALMANIVAGPRHGLLTQNADGTWTYTPDANWNGEDGFSYRNSSSLAALGPIGHFGPAGIATYFGALALLGFRLNYFTRRT